MSSKRSDLQGIRGIAIIAVLLFHFYPNYFPNGYIGVDQFFVLSGYLICLILTKPTKDGSRIGFRDFYFRRVKRIVPLYLIFILFALISLPFLFPSDILERNLESARNSLLFVTNLAGRSPEKKYELMLSLAEDCFTHTWSLSVEMQFYLIVPFLFSTPTKLRNPLIGLVGSFSLVYFLLTDDDTAFNSVFARLWQFLMGFCAQFVSNDTPTTTTDEDEEALLDTESKEYDVTPPSNLLLSFLGLLVSLLVVLQSMYTVAIPSNLLRILVTTLISVLIAVGSKKQPVLLTNGLLVYIGDISYSLYLIHWPIYTYTKIHYGDEKLALTTSLAVSVIAAVVVSETIEKFYLQLDRKSIICLIVGLLVTNSALLVHYQNHLLIDASLLEKDFSKEVVDLGIPTNISVDHVIALNEYWTSHDKAEIHKNECHTRSTDNSFGCDFKVANGNNGSSKLKILLVGNSYVPNIASTFVDVCRGRAASITSFWRVACEPLITTTSSQFSCPGVTNHYVEMVKQEQPDVLFLIARYIDLMMHPLSSGNDSLYLEALSTIQAMEPHVKQKIFILSAGPTPKKGEFMRMLNNGLREGKRVEMESLHDPSLDANLANERLRKIVALCPKCKLVDYTEYLTRNGQFSYYDTRTGLSFFTGGLHLTPVGLALIRPALGQVCE